MASNIEHINKKLKMDTATKIDLLKDYPEKFINPFQNALNTAGKGGLVSSDFSRKNASKTKEDSDFKGKRNQWAG